MFKKTISNFIIIISLLSLAPNAFAQESKQDNIDFLLRKNIIDQNQKIDLNEKISRKDFIKWSFDLFGFNKNEIEKKSSLCLDFEPGSEYIDYFNHAIEMELLPNPGKNKRCYPDRSISKIQALNMLFYLNGIPIPKLYSFNKTPKDVNQKASFAPTVAQALNTNIIQSEKCRIEPYKKITIADTAELLHQTYLYLNPNEKEVVIIEKEPSIDPNALPHLDILINSLKQIKDKYYYAEEEDISYETIVYKALKGLSNELQDPFSYFQEPQNANLSHILNNEFSGIGIRIYEEGDDIVILSIIRNSPADKSGLQAKDIIKKIDDIDIKGENIDEVANLIRGEKGSNVKINIYRKDAKLNKTYLIERDTVQVPQIEGKILNNNIVYLQINLFAEKTAQEFTKIANELIKKNTKGIIVDVRNNPGGYFNTVNEMLGHFIPKGEAVAHIRLRDGTEQSINSEGNATLAAYPLIVIQNKASASASEIFSGAIQDYKLGTIIGTKSFGKGTVQEVRYFNDNSILRLTFAEWLTPLKRAINKIGIMPDIEIEISENDLQSNRDPQLERAIKEII